MDTAPLHHEQPESLLDQVEALTLSYERARMSREIHDGMGQHLHAAILLAETLAEEDASDRRRAHLVHAIQALQREVRRAMNTLMDTPHQALEDMLADPLLDARVVHHLATDVQIVGTTRHTPVAIRHALLRITQEALTNIIKYACARTVRVTLDYTDPQAMRLTIADDGQGFTGHTPQPGHGHGLRTMRERAEALGGVLTVTSTAQGVTVFANVPTPTCPITRREL